MSYKLGELDSLMSSITQLTSDINQGLDQPTEIAEEAEPVVEGDAENVEGGN